MSGSPGKVTGRYKGWTGVSGGGQADERSGAAGGELGPGRAEARGDCDWNWAETRRGGPGGRAPTPPLRPPTSASAHVTQYRPRATGKPAARRSFPPRCGSCALHLQVARERVLRSRADKGWTLGEKLPRGLQWPPRRGLCGAGGGVRLPTLQTLGAEGGGGERH